MQQHSLDLQAELGSHIQVVEHHMADPGMAVVLVPHRAAGVGSQLLAAGVDNQAVVGDIQVGVDSQAEVDIQPEPGEGILPGLEEGILPGLVEGIHLVVAEGSLAVEDIQVAEVDIQVVEGNLAVGVDSQAAEGDIPYWDHHIHLEDMEAVPLYL